MGRRDFSSHLLSLMGGAELAVGHRALGKDFYITYLVESACGFRAVYFFPKKG